MILYFLCFLCQEKFTTRHELALLRMSALMGLVMFGGMSSLFYTQITGILSVSTELWLQDSSCFKDIHCCHHVNVTVSFLQSAAMISKLM